MSTGRTWAPIGLALVAEAAWIAVLAGLLQALALLEPSPGVPLLLAAAVVGLVAARTLPVRLRAAWPIAAFALAFGAALATWLADPDVRAALVDGGIGGIGPAIAAFPGAGLVAVAVARGMGRSRPPLDAPVLGTQIAALLPVLALAAALGSLVGEPVRSQFLAAAQLDVLLFLVTGVLALALARLDTIDPATRLDWQRNPAWLILLTSLVLGTVALALAAATFAGPTIATVVGALVVPLFMVGFVIGFDRRTVRILALSVAVAAIIGSVIRLASPGPSQPGPSAPAATANPVPGVDAATTTVIATGAVLVGLAVLAGLLVVAIWLRRPTGERLILDEVRVIDRGDLATPDRRPSRRLALPKRRPRPTDATSAYRSVLHELAGRPVLERRAGETPAEHARRLREAGVGNVALDLLAADYALVSFGGVELPARETRRAIRRAERVHEGLARDRPGVSGGSSRSVSAGHDTPMR